MGLNIGYLVDPLNPASMDKLDDNQLIMSCVYATANICRYGGHTNKFYSVLDHSWLIAGIMNLFEDQMRLTDTQKRLLELRLLTHDLHEALILDLPRPLKTRMPEFKDAEAAIEGYVQERILGHLVNDSTTIMNTLVRQIDLDICTFVEIPALGVGLFKHPSWEEAQAYTAIQFLVANLTYTGLIVLDYEHFNALLMREVKDLIDISMSKEYSIRNTPEVVYDRIKALRKELSIG